VHLSSVLSDKVLYSWGDNEDVERKVIVISSCLLEDIDSVTKIALLDAADKYVSVDFVLLEKVSSGPSSLSESIDNFNRNICDLENCSFRNHLLGSLRSPVKRKREHAEKFMGYQVEAIKKISKYVAQLKRVGKGHVNKGDDVGNLIEQKPYRKDKRYYLRVLLSKVMERFRACPDLWDPWILKGTPEDKSNSSNDVWEDWSATSIDWEISDNDEENCERMTMQEASGVTEFADDMSGDYVSGMDVDVNVSRPFAMAQTSYDGLQLEDQIVKFRDVDYGDNLLPKLASEAQKNQGRPVLMLVMKQGTSINLAVKPRTWRHRGLLGPTQKKYNLGVTVAMGRFMDDVVDNE
nr:26S proteasome non-ATPase regulatory subunit 9 [Tanacetum cinerariifolium]